MTIHIQPLINLYPMPRTFTMRMRSSRESLWRSLVMNTCRLRWLKKVSLPHRSIRMSCIGVTSFRFLQRRRRISLSRCEIIVSA